jgi:hypothetical protein
MSESSQSVPLTWRNDAALPTCTVHSWRILDVPNCFPDYPTTKPCLGVFLFIAKQKYTLCPQDVEKAKR